MLRLASFNLENLDAHPRAGISVQDRIALLIPQLRRLRPHILCLQEVNARAGTKGGDRSLALLDAVLDGAGLSGHVRISTLGCGGRHLADLHNLVIAAASPPVQPGQTWHELVEAPLWRPSRADPPAGAPLPLQWDRPIQHSAFAVAGGGLVHVVNLHLKAPRAAWLAGQKDPAGHWSSVAGWAEGFFMAAVKQAGQALEARLLVERIFDADPDAMIAVCGDFNATDREAALRLVRGDADDTGNGHLASRMLVSLERSLPDGARFSVIHQGRPVLLDHVLVSRPLLAHFAGFEIHNEALGDELVSPALIAGPADSYHAPVVATFNLSLA